MKKKIELTAVVDVLFFLLAASFGLRYWWPLLSSAGISFDSQALFRDKVGDIEYYPMISGLAHLNFGDNTVWESFGKGIISFPMFPLAWHAFFVGIFGKLGWMIGDLTAMGAYWLVFRYMLRALGFSKIWASCGGMFIMTGAAFWAQPIAQRVASRFGHGNFTSTIDILGRIPRPFITDLYLYAALALLLHVCRNISEGSPVRKRLWFAAGACLAMLLQSDVYAGNSVGPAFVVAIAGTLWLSGKRPRNYLSALRTLVLGAVAFLLPFIIQRLAENPDLPRRFGQVAIGRLHALKLAFPATKLLLASATTILLVALGARLRRSKSQELRAAVAGISIFFLTATISILGPNLFVLVTGKMIQGYHFEIYQWKFFSIATAITAVCLQLHLLRWLWERALKSKFLRKRETLARPAGAAFLIFLTGGIATGHLGHELVSSEIPRYHMRWYDPPYRALGLTYFHDFQELTEELRSPRYADSKAILTFDHQVAVWANVFAGKFAFNPDPFTTVLSDREVEDRLLTALKIMGVDDAGMVALFNDERFLAQMDKSKNHLITNLFLSHNKYTANSVVHFGSFEDYSPAQLERIMKLDYTQAWNLVIPEKEFNRLRQRLQELPAPGDYRLDLVVAINRGLFRKMVPRAELFEETYRNGTFTVYRRR